MKVLHVAYADDEGGAGKAARRLNDLLRRRGVDSSMAVIKKTLSDESIQAPLGKRGRVGCLIRQLTAKALLTSSFDDFATRSINLMPGGLGKWLNASDADVVNLHWINAEAMSLSEIRGLTKPTVWTMHDMWPISGLTHHPPLRSEERVPLRYQFLDRCVTRQKERLFGGERALRLVAPSHWLAEEARTSELASGTQVRVIPNALDQAIFKPLSKKSARLAFNLPLDKQILLFGAVSSTKNPQKGYAYLREALEALRERWASRAALVVFGGDRGLSSTHGFDTYGVGSLHDDVSLALLYNSADVFVAPSLQDNLPNTVLEAKACGIPRVAFNIGGMPDLICHGIDGYLAAPRDARDLAYGIELVLSTKTSTEIGEHELEDRCFQGYRELYESCVSPP